MRRIFNGGNPLDIAERWWEGQPQKNKNLIVGAGVGLALFFTGGLVLQAALTGLLTNVFFWYGLGGRQMTDFMKEWGRTIDIALTVASIAVGVFIGPTMALSMIFIVGFFSMFRNAIVGNGDDKQITIEAGVVK